MECEETDPVWLSKARRGGYFVDLITGMSNGVITVQDSWIQRARPAVVYGIETRVLAPEELVASKIFVARRERFDGADVALDGSGHERDGVGFAGTKGFVGGFGRGRSESARLRNLFAPPLMRQ